MGYRATPNKSDKYMQGSYNLINASKYLGDPTTIYFRSSWEYKLYYYLDNEPKVIKWNVEGTTIPYEIMENNRWTTCRYYPDAYCEIQMNDGRITKNILEIKPYSETQVPTPPKKSTAKSLENYEYKMKTYLKNINKWKAAKAFCDKRGINFYILTEKYFDDKNVKLF